MEKVKITLNQREIYCKTGETVLDVAAKNGIEIPNLCHKKGLEAYGGCGLCLVEIEGKGKLLRACATKVEDGMVINTETQRVKRARKTAIELIMSDHIGNCKGPCSLNCPASTDVQGYLKQISFGNYTEAVRIIKDKIPFPASIGRICPHPCEKSCRRRSVDEPISIAYLKAFAADMDMKSENPYKAVLKSNTGKTVSVIGGGPAGLSAAFYLRLRGHSVTVYDAMPEMGGMLRYGIPEYRLPKKVLSNEINELKRLGITFKNNVKIGEEISFDEIKANSDAVLIAIGAWCSSKIGCEGENFDGVIEGIKFLSAVNSGEKINIEKSVAIIGGGNTAMDACRSAVRCNAEKVYVIYRRTRDEAPAEDIEIEEALEEGVEFKFLTAPTEIIGENGKVKAIKLQKMELGEKDSSGRRKPVPIEGSFETIEVDTVISAIGQKCETKGFDGIELTEKGTVFAKENSMMTNIKGVFAAGDAVNEGASIAINAIAKANLAAESIDAYLNERPFEYRKPFYSEKELEKSEIDKIKKLERAKMAVMLPEKRKKCFDEVVLGFTEEQAKNEAKRCLECGCHDFENCRLIKYANEEPISPNRFCGEKHKNSVERKLVSIERDSGKCMLCGICVRVCNEEVKKGILGLVGRGFDTFVNPEFNSEEILDFCRECQKCAKSCPTGALKILK